VRGEEQGWCVCVDEALIITGMSVQGGVCVLIYVLVWLLGRWGLWLQQSGPLSGCLVRAFPPRSRGLGGLDCGAHHCGVFLFLGSSLSVEQRLSTNQTQIHSNGGTFLFCFCGHVGSGIRTNRPCWPSILGKIHSCENKLVL
jgi:hypothetical protein